MILMLYPNERPLWGGAEGGSVHRPPQGRRISGLSYPRKTLLSRTQARDPISPGMSPGETAWTKSHRQLNMLESITELRSQFSHQSCFTRI